MDTKKWIKQGAIVLSIGALAFSLGTTAFAATSPRGANFAQACLAFMQGRGAYQAAGRVSGQPGAWCLGAANGKSGANNAVQNFAGTCMGGYYSTNQK